MHNHRSGWATRREILLIGLFAVAGLAAQLMVLGPGFPFDDAYIVQHNARALHAGRDLNFAAPPLAGSTSTVHTILVAALMLVLPGLWAQAAAGWIAVALYAGALLALARTYGLSKWHAAALLLLGFTIARTPQQLLNGLETGLALAAVTWSVVLISGSRVQRATPMVAGTLPFIRPELVTLSVLLLATQLWHRRASGDSAWHRAFAIDLGICALAVLPWAAVNVMFAGSLVPGTIAAKAAYFAEACLPASKRTMLAGGGLLRFGIDAGVVVAAVPLLVLCWPGRAGLLLFGALVLVYWRVLPGALHHYDGRYLYVLIPFLILAPICALERVRLRRLFALVLPIAATQSAITTWSHWDDHLEHLRFTETALAPTSAWVREHVPPDAPTLVHDIGFVAYATDNRLVDLVGLKTPASLAMHLRYTLPSCGADRALAVRAVAAAAGAEYVIILDEWDLIFGLSAGLGPHVLLWQSAPGKRHYSVYRLQGVPGPPIARPFAE